jgi:hypothetical protein
MFMWWIEEWHIGVNFQRRAHRNFLVGDSTGIGFYFLNHSRVAENTGGMDLFGQKPGSRQESKLERLGALSCNL